MGPDEHRTPKRNEKKGKRLRNCLTGAQIVVRVVGFVPIHREPVVVPAPVHARHATVSIARTRAERDIVDVVVLLGLPVIKEFEHEPFFKRDAGNVPLFEVVG